MTMDSVEINTSASIIDLNATSLFKARGGSVAIDGPGLVSIDGGGVVIGGSSVGIRGSADVDIDGGSITLN